MKEVLDLSPISSSGSDLDPLKELPLREGSGEPAPPQVYRSEPAEGGEPSADPASGLTGNRRKQYKRRLKKRQQIAALQQEQGISYAQARLTLKGWSPEKVAQWTSHPELIQSARNEGRAATAGLVREWITQGEPLVRWGLTNRWMARLQDQRQYEWKWSDLEAFQAKLEVLAMIPRSRYAAWSTAFQLDAEIREQKRTLVERRRDRFEVLPLFWIEACEQQQLCRLTFLNGTQLTGVPLWFDKYSVVLAPSRENLEPGVLAFFHGLAFVEKLEHQESSNKFSL